MHPRQADYVTSTCQQRLAVIKRYAVPSRGSFGDAQCSRWMSTVTGGKSSCCPPLAPAARLRLTRFLEALFAPMTVRIPNLRVKLELGRLQLQVPRPSMGVDFYSTLGDHWLRRTRRRGVWVWEGGPLPTGRGVWGGGQKSFRLRMSKWWILMHSVWF